MRSSDGEGRSIRSDALYPALSGEWEVPVTRNAKITPVNEGGGGRGRGASPPGSPLAGSPVTRNAEIDPPPRAFAYHRYFRFFLSLFFSTPLNEFFQIQAYLITDFDCWLCYFLGRTATARRLQTTMRACTASFFIFSNAFSIEVSAEIGTE